MTEIVPYAPAEIRRSQRRGRERSVVQFASGGVAADVRVERVDRRNRCSWYALKLGSNESDVSGRLFGMRRGGAVDELGSIDVAPGSMGSARFAVTTPRTGAYQTMYLEIRSAEMLLRVEAPRPPAPSRFGPFKAAWMLLAIGVAASSAGAVPRAFAGDSSHPEPLRVAAAVAPAPLHVAPVSVQSPARVISFSARRDDAPGGESVLASYLAAGERGTIALLDPVGTVIAAGRFSRVGTIRLPVPRAYRAAVLTAQITVYRGDTKAVSGVSVPPNPLPTPLPSPSPEAQANAASDVPAEGITPIDSASSIAAGGLVAVEGHAVAGQSLRLRVAPQTTAMHVELQDETGTTLAETEIPPGARRAVLALPAATSRVTYLLALHYTHNGGEETVIRTVVAAPR
jgi:hypothetical protein